MRGPRVSYFLSAPSRTGRDRIGDLRVSLMPRAMRELLFVQQCVQPSISENGAVPTALGCPGHVGTAGFAASLVQP